MKVINASFVVRTHDEKTNGTIKDINYRITAKFKNETILDQRFHSLDGFIIANLIPSNNSNIHEIISKDQLQQNLSKNALVKVSSKNPIILKSKILADGGLYNISVVLEKSSKGLKLDSDKKINLFISIGKTIPFVIKISSNNNNGASNNDNIDNLTLKVKTFYDEIKEFHYDQENSHLSFKMPFTWNLDYVSQIVNLHEEIVIQNLLDHYLQFLHLQGTLNGMEIPRNTILIDDYSDQHNRIVHIVITNFKLKEFTNQIVKEGGNSYAIYELKPIK